MKGRGVPNSGVPRRGVDLADVGVFAREGQPGVACFGVVDAGEQCDDGNFVGGDECSATCSMVCGNGLVDGRYRTPVGHRNAELGEELFALIFE